MSGADPPPAAASLPGLPAGLDALPVAAVLAPLALALEQEGRAILQAPPGSGKTTLVPLALRGAPWLAGRKIVLLEPRRLAARAAAERMAALLGEAPGATVGYAMRFERRVGPLTRIEVVTEGLLARRLIQDPALEDTGLLILDEFHERSLDADLVLALAREIRGALRPDLRLLVMSATLDAGEIAAFLDAAPVITAEGRLHPVDVRHLAEPGGARLEDRMADAIRLALAETRGGVLAFLPGVGEIRRTAERLAGRLPADVEPMQLHGLLPRAQQDQVIRPAAAGRRKLVLATSIAETSLTIDGIAAVVDGGLARRQQFSPRTGMSRLVTVEAARANAEQRRGRAGRLGPGICWRLWSEAEERGRAARLPAEITMADLAPLVLDLAAWGIADAAGLAWLTPPPAAAFQAAQALLRELEALDPDGRITAHGRALARLPLHPRLGHMLLCADADGEAGTAIAIAALLESRDPFPEEGADLAPRLARLDRLPRGHETVRLVHDLRRRIAPAALAPADPAEAGAVLAFAFPDRIARRRGAGDGSYLLASGRGAVLDPGGPLAGASWLAVAELDDVGSDARIRLAARLDERRLRERFAERLVTADEVGFDDATGNVRGQRVTRLGAIRLHVQDLPQPPPALLVEALIARLRAIGIDALPWPTAALALRRRLAFLARHEPDSWPSPDPDALLATLAQRLLLLPTPPRRPEAIPAELLLAVVEDVPTHDQRRRLEALAPTHIQLPGGQRLPIDYAEEPPVLRVRLQDLLGVTTTPTIRAGRTPLMLHLLSPARRPVQVTRDLPGFWQRGWPEVRKELRGRYPKHAWPEDPTVAPPPRKK